ncbi:hypothetical protein EDF56_101250 [Novosphingobium sp. PhB165]|uniref:hypothetical protein n=1 Tax=Novosphingobium sp. PhB165 TaxID=2485105 RepID=UPI00104821BC|nr:hypothetical protein [Novosphingobium sp. PhB165]TCM21584.1 hypothetical protein EDF56_101250 [Novosphingobium sp. PhB165]
MQDQHFMQQWNAGHDRFSGDFDRLARKLFKALGSSLRGGHPNDPDDQNKRPAPQEAALTRRARLTGIGILAGILAGSSLAMVTPLVTALDCPQHANQICVRAALA